MMLIKAIHHLSSRRFSGVYSTIYVYYNASPKIWGGLSPQSPPGVYTLAIQSSEVVRQSKINVNYAHAARDLRNTIFNNLFNNDDSAFTKVVVET